MKRSAFTLVELLVVVAVILLLAALLLAAVNRGRETARRNQCLSRQRDLAIAMITYANDTNGLPGSLNELGNTPIHSWTVSVFPMIGENKRYQVLMDGQTPAEAFAPIPALLCPSDRPEGNARLNYVVNCGPREEKGVTDGDNAPTFTLFKDRRVALTSINKKVKIEEIPDGASNTILLSENLDAGVWFADWTLPEYSPNELQTNGSSGTPTRSKAVVSELGFIWLPGYFAPNSFAKGPRPSAKHPGTVNVAFADGSAKPMNDDISMEEYLRAVCPNDEKAREPFPNGGMGW